MFAAPYESASPGERSPYLGVNEDEHLMHFLGAFLGGVMAGGLAALVHWGMEMYLAWAPGSPMFFSGIRATTITVSFVGAVVGALAALLFAGIERGGEGYHIKGSTYGSLIGALAGLLATYFDWSPDAVAQLRGFNWASLAEKFWGEGHVSPFWIRILGGACSGAAIMLIGIVVGVAGSWGDAAFSWLSRIVRLAIAWSIVGFLLWRMLVMIGP